MPDGIVPRKVKDLTGQSFGRWTVLGFSSRKGTTYYWHCRCECGTERIVFANSLRKGTSQSCGCLHREIVGERRTHGESKHNETPEYRTWCHMLARCRNRKNPQYKDYGGRGITVCLKWLDYPTFLADMGRKPSSEHTIERIDNSRGYSPDNCKWATRSEQQRNRRQNVIVNLNGKTMVLEDALQQIGRSRQSHHFFKHYYGLSAQDALNKMIKGQ